MDINIIHWLFYFATICFIGFMVTAFFAFKYIIKYKIEKKIMDSPIISIAKDFSTTCGARWISQGNFSGELFRDKLLIPVLKNAIDNDSYLVIDLDGGSGYAYSFLEEAFGGLIDHTTIPYDTIIRTLKFSSFEEPYLINEIREYILEAHNKRI